MKAITRLGLIVAAFSLALGAVAQAAPKAERATRYLTVSGLVLQINEAQRTLLVTDRSSAKLYLVEMPEGAAFHVTFGRYMGMREPAFKDVFVNERVEIRCLRGKHERLATLPDNRQVVVLTAAQ